MSPRKNLYDDDGGFDDAPFADINVTPLVDVMLVLLIVFVVAAPLMVPGLPINLPKSSVATQSHPDEPIVVTLGPEDQVYLNDQSLALSALAPRLRTLRAERGDAMVFVRADRSIPYGHVIDILNRFAASGFARLSLQTEAGVDAPQAPAR